MIAKEKAMLDRAIDSKQTVNSRQSYDRWQRWGKVLRDSAGRGGRKLSSLILGHWPFVEPLMFCNGDTLAFRYKGSDTSVIKMVAFI